MLDRDARARRQAPPQAMLRRCLGLRGGYCAAAGGWIRRRRRRATGHRRRGRDGLNFPCARIFVVRSAPHAAWSILFFLGRGRRGTDWN